MNILEDSLIKVFHGQDLDQTFENACSQTLADYRMEDCQINHFNNEYVIVVKTEKISSH
ncbi:hypothetical protein FC65_GL001793 [Ligilactobacillus acidipiscis DSM 15836]|uniref:Uncharacterized protein n=2 Tax=Ligilactobacillus acidipiscis TaxID=89059 RepID=A0A0R2KFE3_9LACO|nr:hypothetical protein FC65_GL001793 [Ligilactobacillus acidipiscis DSM 15836]KRN88097.1 hypothetical protein IV43_GL000844 [Ligilactobacillus acidipiscis]